MKSKWINELEGYENCTGYKIYEDGSIKSFRNTGKGFKRGLIYEEPQREIKQVKDHKGYLQTTLRGKLCKPLRLVALAFIPNPENKPQVNHLDGVKSNNHVSNLEWATNSDNQIHAFKTGLNKPHRGAKNYQYSGNHKNCKKVRQLTLDGKEIAIHKSLAIAGRSIGKSYSGISNAVNGKNKTAYGYKWEAVD